MTFCKSAMNTGVVDEKLATWKFLGDPAEVGEAEPLEDTEGCEAGDDVEGAWYEGVPQDVRNGCGQLGLLLARLLYTPHRGKNESGIKVEEGQNIEPYFSATSYQ